MTATLLKRCPECGSEFQHWVESCIDCGGPLELSDGSAPPAGGKPAGATDVAPEDRDVCIRVVEPSWARSLSAALAAAGVAHRIDDPPPAAGGGCRPGVVGVWVRTEDRAAALAVDAEHERTQIPDLPGEAASAEHCPACGEPCSPDAVECASCGLEFPSVE